MLYPPHVIGGAEKSVALLSEAQAAKGVQVAAACTTPGAFTAESRNGVNVYRMSHEMDFWAEDWPKHNVFERALRRFKMPFNYKLEEHFKKVIADFKPDLVHTHSLTDVSTRVWLAAKAYNLPIVHTLRDYDLLCANSAMFLNGKRCSEQHLKCKFFSHFKHAHHLNVDTVVGVGAETLQTHLDYGLFSHIPEHRRKVIWNPAVVEGIAADYRKPKLDGPIRFGYLGRICTEKGVGTLLDACRLLLPENGWQLFIAGKATSENDPLLHVEQGIPVEYIGFIPPAQLFEQIDVLIVPSIWAEPLPRTILEAYAMGVPALGAISGGIPDLIGSNNHDWLFEPGNSVNLAQKMKKIIQDGRECLPSKTSFQHVLFETTPDTVAQRYINIYEELLNTNS
jgi:glycosyltransferase involved in cell wall biosynthesis